MKNQIEIKMAHEKSNIELLIEILVSPHHEKMIGTKLGREAVDSLCNAIINAALTDASNIRKEANVAVVKLAAALETATRLLADAQKRTEEAEQMIAELSRPKA